MRFVLAVVALAQLASAGAFAEGEIWVWTTADGTVHYTDDQGRVPEAFRESARVAHREVDGTSKPVPSRAPSAPVASPAAQVRGDEEEPPAPVDLEAAAEEAWRAQARALHERIATLDPRVEACASDHINRSPGDGSRERREEREEAERCARAKQDLAAARADLAALEERAQRAGVPPGWLRTED
jgi:Domain of unknown function (DUF4124)